MTATIADLLVCALAREIATSGVRVFAVTSPASVVAGLAARELGRPDLALASGFTALDGSPIPAVTLGEAGLFAAGPAPRDEPGDTFAMLRRGWVGVATAPAQLDSHGRTNLSAVGTRERPTVALPGARGLPDNNRSPSRVWYLLPAHGPRQLVDRVDVICGAVPLPQAVRRLLTPAGCFELGADGWQARWLHPGAEALVAQAPGLGVALTGSETVVEAPDERALDAVRRVDPHGVRDIEFAGGSLAADLWAQAAAREREAGAGRRA